MITTHARCRKHNTDKSALVASSVQPAPNMGLFQCSPVPLSIDLAACAHPYTYCVLYTWAFRGVVSPDFRVISVQFASMHIHMYVCGLLSMRIQFASAQTASFVKWCKRIQNRIGVYCEKGLHPPSSLPSHPPSSLLTPSLLTPLTPSLLTPRTPSPLTPLPPSPLIPFISSPLQSPPLTLTT